MNILVCEDEEILLTALEFRIRKHGFKVVLAKNGVHAKELLQTEDISCAVLDIILPEMDGMNLLNFIQKDLKKDIPVVVISELGHDFEILKAIKLGAIDFVTKPFKPNELVLRIRRIFQDKGVM